MTGWCIGIGICLKIGDIAVSVVFGADKAFSIGKLIGNRKRRRSGKIAIARRKYPAGLLAKKKIPCAGENGATMHWTTI